MTDKWPDKQWYEVRICVEGKFLGMSVTQSMYEARKTARELSGSVHKIPTPKAVVR